MLCAVLNYVNNPVHLAASGIVDKLLVGPLWRIMENVDHILDLNDIWMVFKNTIELFQRMSQTSMKGNFQEFTQQMKF